MRTKGHTCIAYDAELRTLLDALSFLYGRQDALQVCIARKIPVFVVNGDVIAIPTSTACIACYAPCSNLHYHPTKNSYYIRGSNVYKVLPHVELVVATTPAKRRGYLSIGYRREDTFAFALISHFANLV